MYTVVILEKARQAIARIPDLNEREAVRRRIAQLANHPQGAAHALRDEDACQHVSACRGRWLISFVVNHISRKVCVFNVCE